MHWHFNVQPSALRALWVSPLDMLAGDVYSLNRNHAVLAIDAGHLTAFAFVLTNENLNRVSTSNVHLNALLKPIFGLNLLFCV